MYAHGIWPLCSRINEVMPVVMARWVSPLVCTADKYGIGIHIQSLHWVVDYSWKRPLLSPPLSTFTKILEIHYVTVKMSIGNACGEWPFSASVNHWSYFTFHNQNFGNTLRHSENVHRKCMWGMALLSFHKPLVILYISHFTLTVQAFEFARSTKIAV